MKPRATAETLIRIAKDILLEGCPVVGYLFLCPDNTLRLCAGSSNFWLHKKHEVERLYSQGGGAIAILILNRTELVGPPKYMEILRLTKDNMTVVALWLDSTIRDFYGERGSEQVAADVAEPCEDLLHRYLAACAQPAFKESKESNPMTKTGWVN